MTASERHHHLARRQHNYRTSDEVPYLYHAMRNRYWIHIKKNPPQSRIFNYIAMSDDGNRIQARQSRFQSSLASSRPPRRSHWVSRELAKNTFVLFEIHTKRHP